MTIRPRRFASAAALIEVMVAMVVLAVAALGALSYQYHAAAQVRTADKQITGTQIARLVLEDWKSTGGAVAYDPACLGLGFVTVFPEENHVDHTGGHLGSKLYILKVDGKLVLTALSYRDIARDDTSAMTLRELTVVAQAGDDFTSSDLSFDSGESFSSLWAALSSYAQQLSQVAPVQMTGYVRIDASSG